MDIKLRARLSAYSKIESVPQSGSEGGLPDTNLIPPGTVVGVGENGTFIPVPSITKEDVDTLFTDVDDEENNVVTKEEIDSLFDPKEDESVENNTTNDPRAVTREEIDSLFS